MSRSWAILAAFVVLSLTHGASAEKKASKSAATKVTAFAPAPTRRPAIKRRAVEVEWEGSWWPAEVLEQSDGQAKIRYAGFGSEWDEWVGPSRRRPVSPPLTSASVGQRVEIEWHGSLWSGEVIEEKNGFFKVHYAGWGPEWDEWLEISRLRRSSSPAVAERASITDR